MSDLVTFRKFPDGAVIALFPKLFEGQDIHGRPFISSYMHIGQHSGASDDLISDLSPATVDEYSNLKAELTSIGYDLEVTS
jgi:hypothetical protein